MSLQKQTISGLFWTFSQRFSVQLINFGVSIIMARVLLPADYGLIGMLSVFMAIGSSLMDSGLSSSLIRTPNADQKDYSTVFFINIIGSIFIYVILFFSAPFIASFYDQEILTPIIRIYTISFIISAFVGVQSTRLTKEMDFKTQMKIQIPSVIGGGILGVILAYLDYGVWSLVWMNLFQSFLSAVQHWIYSGWRPNFLFDKERFKYHFSFGYKLTLSGLLDTIYNNIYNLIIGKFFPVAYLGYYTRAKSLQQLPVQNISTALNKVTYPMFSSIQHENEKLKMAYKKLMQQVLFWIAPTMILLGVIAEPLIRFLLTEKWVPAVPYFQTLCAAGILYPLNSYNLNILKVKGRSELFLKLEIIKKAFITVGIIVAIPFGIYGLLYLQVIISFVAYFINSWYSGKMIGYPMTEQVKNVAPMIILAALVGVLSWLIDKYVLLQMLHMIDFMRVGITGCLYFILYLGISQLIKMPAIIDFRRLILKR
ncbi:lipopolysaccharide biosynthesis protein [Pontibacter sp. 172403-2]|uniref:lipopolysaccharide biosynthesis protein n=1 Tax=Pontibacter rufus TaxID=2791028 RepID=UPI0018AF63F1|nr:lipopolysaccharide biosynthesis protein [Pontibacter sp. 172403-2]